MMASTISKMKTAHVYQPRFKTTMTMKRFILQIKLGVLLLLTSCYEDIGNYEYKEVEDPIVSGLEGVTFPGYIGDSLIIEPTIKHSLVGTENLSFEWEIYNHNDMRGEFYYGPSLRMLFNLKPDVYMTKFTITNKVNGMKYFYKFSVEGRTEFSKGMVVLSDDEGVSRLSFVKPGNTVQPNIYEGLHGENLPKNPKHILLLSHFWQTSYQIVTGEEDKPGVVLDANTMLRLMDLKDNFFQAPDGLVADRLMKNPTNEVSVGVFNGKLYGGFWQTCPCSPLYGNYGDPAAGDYNLAPQFNAYMDQHFTGYDLTHKRLVQFNLFIQYLGADYFVQNEGEGPWFNPKTLDIELLYSRNEFERAMMLGRETDGKIYEYAFNDFQNAIIVKYKREFPGASLIEDNTLWASTGVDVMYFTSSGRIYEYNTTNQVVKLLDATFGGKAVTMLKHVSTNLILAGTAGAIHYIEVSPEENGTLYRTIANIPGNPVDIAIRE
jgi:hypothetical protein